MVKLKKIFIITIAILFIIISGWLIYTPRILSNKINNIYGVFIPNGVANEYFYDPFNYSYWKYDLNSNEQKKMAECISEYKDIWYELSNESLSKLIEAIPQHYKFNLSDINVVDSYYCLYSNLYKKYMCIEDGKSTISYSIIIIWDSSNSEYYCIHLAVR